MNADGSVIEYASQDSATNAAPTLTTNLQGGPMAADKPIKLHPNTKDISGKRFGRLLIIGVSHSEKRARLKGTVLYWKCKCDCGNEVIISGPNLNKGDSHSCGCYHSDLLIAANTKHGFCGTSEYDIWNGMKQRCENPNSRGYKNYGGRGITVCQEWIESFDAFYAYMGPRPTNLSIDRINNDGNYEPGNCRWATAKEQAQNTRRQKRKC